MVANGLFRKSIEAQTCPVLREAWSQLKTSMAHQNNTQPIFPKLNFWKGFAIQSSYLVDDPCKNTAA